MGAALGDFNLDGLPDLYLAATSKNLLLQQLPDLSYVEVGQTTGADSLDGSLEAMASNLNKLEVLGVKLQVIEVKELEFDIYFKKYSLKI